MSEKDAFSEVILAGDKSDGRSSRRSQRDPGQAITDLAQDPNLENNNTIEQELNKTAVIRQKPTFSEDDIWLVFNKYLYTLVLLFMATFHFNLLGFLYFALFLLHTFAFYSFRLIDTPFDYLLKVERAGKSDIRSFFTYCNAIVSSLALVAIMVMKIMLSMSGQDSSAFDVETQTANGIDGSDTFSVMKRLIPDFDSLYTLFSTIMAFLFSLVLFYTRRMEVAENVKKQKMARSVAKAFPFSNLTGQQADANDGEDGESMLEDNASVNSHQSDSVLKRKAALKQVSRTIQDYNFKYNLINGASFLLLGVIAASTLTWVNVPYQVIFLFHAFFVGFNYTGWHRSVQKYASWVLLIILIVELVLQYTIFIRSFSKTFTSKQKYIREVQGLLQNSASFAVLGIKVLLMIVESSRFQFQQHLSQLTFIPEAQNLVDSVCSKSFSFLAKIMAPISQFLFCMVAIIFALLHPSVVFLPLIPFTILGFFTDLKKRQSCSIFSVNKRFFLLLAMGFTISLYVYHLVQLQKNNTLLSKWKQAKQASTTDLAYFWEILGFDEIAKNKQSLLIRTLFPFHQEIIFIMIMATCSKYADVKADFAQRQEEKRIQKERKSVSASQRAYDEAIHEDGFSSSATELGDKENGSPEAGAAEVQADETLRGKFYQLFYVGYSSLKWVLKKTLNFATIHSTKIAMWLLFAVSVIEPNVFNAVLFILFLLICMGNNSQMLALWKFTLGLIGVLLFSQYSVRVLVTNEYQISLKHHNKSSFVCLSGLIKCEDSDVLTYSNLEFVNFMLYLPYLALLLTFVIGYFIQTSDHYQSLMKKYINREVVLQKMAKSKKNLDEDAASLFASEISLDADIKEEESDALNPDQDSQDCDENKQERAQDSEMREHLKNAVFLVDPVTKFFIQQSLYVLIFAMALLSSTLPLALTNVLMLVVMTILVTRALQVDTQIQIYQNSHILLYVVKYLTLISIAVRYAAQFYLIYMQNERIADPTKTEEDKGQFYQVTALLFGYTSDLFVLRVLTLTVILVISHMQLVMIQNQVLMDIISEVDIISQNRQKKHSMWGHCKVYVIFTLYAILPVGLLGVIFLIVAQYPSFLGLIAMFATVIILQMHAFSFWHESYKLIGLFTQFFVVGTYALDFFIFVMSDWYPWIAERDNDSNYNFLMNSLASNIEYFNQDQKFFTRIFWLYIILAFCFLQKLVSRYQNFFQLQMPEKPTLENDLQFDQDSSSQRNKTPTKPRAMNLLDDADDQGVDDLDNRSQQDESSPDQEEYRRKLQIYEYESSIRDCLQFKNDTMVFGFTHGVTMTVVLCIIVMFIKLNITSLIYLVALIFVYRVQYTPSRFRSTLDDSAFQEKKATVNRALRNLIILASVLILTEYSLITIHNFTQEKPNEKSVKLDVISGWEAFVSNRLCYLSEFNSSKKSQCLLDWNDWLQIGKKSIKIGFFISQYFLLMMAYFARHFTRETSNGITDLTLLPEPVYGDAEDFTTDWSIKQKDGEEEQKVSTMEKLAHYTNRLVNFTFFYLFPYVLVAVIFFSVISFDGFSFADLVDIGFLITSFWLLAYIKNFYAKNQGMLTFLRAYNITIISILIIFQAPFFVCPVTQPTTLLGDIDDQDFEPSYIPARVCIPQRVTRTSGTDTVLNFYAILAQCLGLKKYTNESYFPLAYLLIVLVTEVQTTMFNHPYFKTYTLQEMRNQKLDGRMRGFMTVENYHLNRKWAYKAIKQQIQILHDRLLRIATEYNQLINENVYWSTEAWNRKDQDNDEKQPLRLADSEKGDHSEIDGDKESALLNQDGGDKTQEFARMQALEATLNDKKFIEMVEDIAIQLLMPNLPVISLKKLKNAVREAILERQNSFLQWDEDVKDGETPRIKKVDIDDLRELVYSLISPLQRAVYRDNRLSLYNKDGVGLNFALQEGEHLDKGDDCFYYSVFIQKEEQKAAIQQDKKQESSMSEPVIISKSGEEGDDQQQIEEQFAERKSFNSFSSKSSYSDNIGDYALPTDVGRNQRLYGKHESELLKHERAEHQDGLEINQDWKETLDVLREKEEQVYQPFMYRVQNGFKRIILEFGTNKLIFYSLYDKKSIMKSNATLKRVPTLILLQAFFISQAENFVFALILINFAQSATLINLVLPLSAFYYALLESPAPSCKYWRFVSVWVLITIAAKLTIQLPVFCSTPAFGIFECDEEVQSTSTLVTRIDYIIGLTKFSGPASYPKNIGILPGILWDLLILLMLVNLKSYLVITGQWHYVRNDNNIHCNPKFKSKFNQKTEREIALGKEQRQLWQDEYPNMTAFEKVKFNFKLLGENIRDFFYKLQPRYMERVQPNLDLRRQNDNGVVHFNPNKVKPGRDYFNGNFFTLLIIFFYNLIFYKSITGASNIADNAAAIQLDHFTVTQVLLLLTLMLMMMVERMLYRTRKNNNWVTQPHLNSQVNSQWDWAKHTLTFKLVIYSFLVIYLHVYAGFVMPAQQGIKLSKNTALLINYILWVFHFAYAALQLKYGYPQAPYKTTFMRDTSWYTVMLFRIYRAIPFIWEMKVIIDWTVTHTCLDLFQWFRLDDAFNYVYYNKYQSDQRKQRREFQERHWTEKFFVGFCFALGIIMLILAPILLFSGINPTMVGNPVMSGNIGIRFELNNSGNEYSIFTSQAFNIRDLEEEEEKTFYETFNPLDQEFNIQQAQRVQFTPYSLQNWVISTPALERLVQDLDTYSTDKKAEFALKSSWGFTRGSPTGKETTKGDIVVKLPLEQMRTFTDLIQAEATNEAQSARLKIDSLFPKMLRLGQTAETMNLQVLPKEGSGASTFFSVDLILHRTRNGEFYWTFEVIEDPNVKADTDLFTEKQNSGYGDDLIFVLYNEPVIGSVFSGVISMSVIGIYVTIVYAVGRFLRIIFDRYSEKAIYEELPETGKLMEICEGIFIAQLEGDMVKEKRLYDLLIIIYRSPELLIKMTGTKQEYLKEPTVSDQHSGNGSEAADVNYDNAIASTDEAAAQAQLLAKEKND